jgi:uncharacterized membrane protein
METAAADLPTEIPINRIPLTRPFHWLSLGWRDMITARPYSLVYGGAVALISLLITLTLTSEGYGFLMPFLVAGFYLLAPAIGLGLVQMSANLEKGNKLQFCQALEALRGNQGQLGMVIAGLSIIAQVWIAANFVLFALLYTGFHPPLDRFVSTVFLSEEGRTFAIASVLLGFVLAWAAFAISAVSIPMLVDRDVDGWTAIRTSVRAVTHNWPAMSLWAALIVAVIAIGLSPFYLGLVIALPVVGHATWHAYRDLVPAPV